MISYYALGWWSVRQSSHSFPAATHSNIFVVSGGVVRHWQRHVHALFVYLMLAIGRLVSGFPHGAFFGSERSCYQKLSNPEKSPPPWRDGFRDDSRQFAGHSAGNVFSQEFSWRYTFLLIAVFNIAVWHRSIFGCQIFATRRKEICGTISLFAQPGPVVNFRRHDVGNAGVFAWFSYVKPYMMFISVFRKRR